VGIGLHHPPPAPLKIGAPLVLLKAGINDIDVCYLGTATASQEIYNKKANTVVHMKQLAAGAI